MQPLFEIQQIIINQFKKEPFYKRQIISTFSFDNTICGITGPRGVGKTTFLLDQAIQHNAEQGKALYISADHIYFLDHKLLNLVDQLYKETNVKLICIDEIHKYPNWNQELKNISDTYPSLKIIFSGSSAIDLIKSKYDLSRRVTLVPLNGLSFREYIEFELGIKLPIVSLKELLSHHTKIASELKLPKILFHFNQYLSKGYYPLFRRFKQNKELYQIIQNAVQKNIYEDIATCHQLKTSSLSVLESLLKFTINSAAGELSAYKLANTLKKDYATISEFLKLLTESGLVRGVYPKKTGHGFLKNPSKLYPDNTTLIHSAYLPIPSDHLRGKLRETFFVSMTQNAALTPYYSKQGDFEIDHNIFEIGGKAKKTSQIENLKNGYLVVDGITVGLKNKIPLYLFGLLY